MRVEWTYVKFPHGNDPASVPYVSEATFVSSPNEAHGTFITFTDSDPDGQEYGVSVVVTPVSDCVPLGTLADALRELDRRVRQGVDDG